MKIYDLVIFDLDGTLLDTSKGIYNSVRYAERKLNLKPIVDKDLKRFVGPPPLESYQRIYDLEADIAMEATKLHREYANERGVFEANIYEGIIELLQFLRSRNYKIAVATLKAQELAIKILDYFNIIEYFDTVVGIDKGESLTKADTLRIAMSNSEHNNNEGVVLIGDSFYDAEGAAEVQIDFIGVTYGFGFSDNSEIDEYRHVAKVSKTSELLELFK